MVAKPLTASDRSEINVRHVLLVILFFVLATVVLTWPLALRASSAVVGRHGDNMHFVWMVGWFERALLQEHRLPYHVPVLNFPEGWEMARSEIPTTLILLGLLPGALAAPVLGYNVAVLGSFILSGLAMYFWIWKITGNRWAGLIAGTAFAFLPFRFAHFRAGHLNVLATMWFPLILWGLSEVLADRKASRGYPIMAGLSIGLLSHSSQYATYLTLLVLAVSVTLYLAFFGRDRIRDPALWRQFAWMAGACLPLLLTGVWPYLTLSAEGALPSRNVFAVAGGSASLTDFILPSTDHFLWGQWVAESFPRDQWIEGSLYLGAVSLPLALVGMTAKRIRRYLPLLLLVFLCGLVVALGTHLHWNEAIVRLALPRAIGEMLGREDLAIRLPGFYLYQFVPYFDRLRTFKRAAILCLVITSALAGVGADQIQRRFSRARIVPWIIMGLLLFDFYPGPFDQFAAVGPRPVDLWLRARPDEGALAEFPFELETEQIQVYYTLEHGKPYLGGFFSAFPPRQYRQIRPVMESFPNRQSLQLLEELGVKYILVHRESYQSLGEVLSTLNGMGWSSQGSFDGIDLFVADDRSPSGLPGGLLYCASGRLGLGQLCLRTRLVSTVAGRSILEASCCPLGLESH